MVLILFNAQGVLHLTKRGVVVVVVGGGIYSLKKSKSVTAKIDLINSINSSTTK